MRLRWKRSCRGRDLRARLGLYVLFVSLGPGGAWRWSVVHDCVAPPWKGRRFGSTRDRREAMDTAAKAALVATWVVRLGRWDRRRKARAGR